MPQSAVTLQELASAFYAALDMDVSFYAAIWHTYKVGHLLTADLDRICLGQGLSMADVHLMEAVRIDGSERLRATDLAQTLRVSNAALFTRIARLKSDGMLARQVSSGERHVYILYITAKGISALDNAISAIERHAHFIAAFRRLPQSDQMKLVRRFFIDDRVWLLSRNLHQGSCGVADQDHIHYAYARRGSLVVAISVWLRIV